MLEINKKYIDEQMKLLFRGADLSVPRRRISNNDRYKLLDLNIKLIKASMTETDNKQKKRAEWTISNLEEQKTWHQ